MFCNLVFSHEVCRPIVVAAIAKEETDCYV